MSEMLDDRAARTPGLFAACLPAVLALCALCTPPANAATRKPAPPPLADFARLSGARGAACSAPGDTALAGMGEPTVRRCAWSQHIEMLYWQDLPAPPVGCLPAPAVAWHRLGVAARAQVPPWNGSWSGQSLLAQGEATRQAAALWRRPDGQWSAALWRWRPSTRLATRNWQAAQWEKVTAAARAIDAGNGAPPRSALTAAWLDASQGKPRMIDADAARWVSNGVCLNLRTAPTGQSQLHLPYSRDDARQEQRSAMQVQLARRYPNVEWLRPFTLLDPATAGARSGAKFAAVWKEGTALQGQLWITLPDDAGIVRARMSADLPHGARAAEPLRERAALLERELKVLAHAWEARHE